MNELFTNRQTRRLDKLTIESGISGEILMENAGKNIAEEIIKRFLPCPAIVLCGPGNNGGDGFVIARHLQKEGWDITVATEGDFGNLKGDAKTMSARYNGKVVTLSPEVLKDKKLVIDAVFGSGLSRPVKGNIAKTLGKIKADTVAVDIPSGINGDTGQILGTAAKAKLTVTFSAKKPGHLLLPGKEYCGETVVVNIGHPKNILSKIKCTYFENSPSLWLQKFPWPAADKHKYKRGHAVIAGGPKNMTGAAKLAAISALRTSAGLVTIACPKPALDVYAKALKAVMTKPVSGVQEFKDFIKKDKTHSILIGPGFGVGKKTKDFVLAALKTKKPCVLDADALTSFKGDTKPLFNTIKGQVIMTPHAGEFKKLFGNIGENKLEAALRAAKKSGAVIILKGEDTVIASPQGYAVINSNAPATLATAGSGDVLAGINAGLLASGMDAFDAACAAVWIHGEAANLFGLGLTAEDLVSLIPKVLEKLKKQSVG